MHRKDNSEPATTKGTDEETQGIQMAAPAVQATIV
jgi:hypothetical protein